MPMLSSLLPFSFLPQLPRQRISRVLARPRRHDLPVAVATPDHAAVWRHRDDVELMMPAWFLHAPPLPPLPALVRVLARRCACSSRCRTLPRSAACTTP